MKSKLVLSISLIFILFTVSSFVFIYNSGVAGYTGSPGETNCSSCHGGGSSASSAIAIGSTPSFSNNEYAPGTTYTIDITITASGFGKFGFGCEILDASNVNAGLMQNPGAGVKFLNSGPRKNAVHSTGKISSGSAIFTFEWVAPQSGSATFYVSGNAVNANNSTSGDFPLSPISQALEPEEPIIDPVSLSEVNTVITNVLVYPVPSKGLATISYSLKQTGQIEISICDLRGKELKKCVEEEKPQGTHNTILNLDEIAAGVYFIKFSMNGKKATQKLLVI